MALSLLKKNDPKIVFLGIADSLCHKILLLLWRRIPFHCKPHPMPIKRDAFTRFQEKIDRHISGCWLWTGSLNPKGFPQISVNGKPMLAHRFSFQHFFDEMPAWITQSCGNRKCVKPDHLIIKRKKHLSTAERFTEKYITRPNGCWDWIGSHNHLGYGQIHVNGVNKMAHRFSYEQRFGPIPQGLYCCHKCDNPKCVNPDHLFIGTQSDNMQDCRAKNRTYMIPPQHGSKNPAAITNEETVIEIRKMIDNGFSQMDACRKFNLSKSIVSRIARHNTWTQVKD